MIIIPGIPVPQARMRHSSFRGFPQIFDPNARQKADIRKYILENYPRSNPQFPRVSFVFFMPIPKSTSKRVYNQYSCGTRKHTKKPDVDNLVKLYLDCVDGLLLTQDSRVSLGFAVKLYHPEPKTIIWIEETIEELTPLEVDRDAWLYLQPAECEIQFPH